MFLFGCSRQHLEAIKTEYKVKANAKRDDKREADGFGDRMVRDAKVSQAAWQ